MQKRTAFITALLALAVATCRNDEGARAPTELRPPLASFVASPAAVTLVGAGDVSSCSHHNDQSTAKLLDTIPGTVFVTGDNAAPSGSSSDYGNCYDPTWGRQKARTYPAPGDVEYQTTGAAGYFGYFGAAAGDATKGYYSYTLGTWHVVVLNSQLSMALGSAQEQWLKADLAANSQQCTLAYWHLPLFYSGATANTRASVKPLWDDLYAAGAEVVLNSHTRNYERFAPQRPDAVADSTYGIREFIVGTGGLGTWAFGPTAPNSEVRGQVYGVLRLTLDSLRYSWQFVPVTGTKFVESGSGTCHTAPIPVAKPGGPYHGEGSITFDGSTSFSPQGYEPLAYAWTFGDGASGTGVSPSHAYAAAGTYTVTLTVTDAHGTVSAAATTTALVQNTAPIVNVGPDVRALPGQPAQVTTNFTDLGANGPWSYQIVWGDGTSSTGSATTQGAFRVSHTYAQVGLDSARVTVTDAAGSTGADTLAVLVEPPGTPETLLIAGDIGECSASGDEATANLLYRLPGTVFTAGDNTYPNGAAADYASCYALAWGRHRNRTYATLGNHDYGLGNAFGTWDYFGSGAGDRGLGYYSVDLGSSWHVVVLNSNYTFVPTAQGSAQELWLKADLAAAAGKCIAAVWHHPKFYSSTEGPLSAGTITNAFWTDLYAAHADLIVNGHMHSYERFAQVDPSGNPDPSKGIREIIAGTGGAWPDAQSTYFWPTSEAYIPDVWGVLQLTLKTGSYSWRFVPEDGETASDSGSAACHNVASPNNTPPTAQAGGPYSGAEGAAVSFDGSGSSAAGGGSLTYAWTFGDGATGSGVNPVHTYADNGSYAVTLTVTDGSGLTSAASTATATIANVAPTVAAGSALSGSAGAPV
ncbi:MAG TPA: PKD domain-containing protein, partial [Gemmatimonadales bacterium]